MVVEREQSFAQTGERRRFIEPPEDVIVKAQSGDPIALNDLCGCCRPGIYSYSFGILHNEQKADDVTQEVLMKLVEGKITSYDPAKGLFSTWLRYITRNQAIDMLREETRPARRKNGSSSVKYALIDPGPSLDELVQKEMDAEAILQACEQLPQNLYRVIRMTSFDGMSDPETARELNIPLGTIKTRRRRALSKLRLILQSRGTTINPDYGEKASPPNNIEPLNLQVLRILLENGENPISDHQIGDKLSRTIDSIGVAIRNLRQSHKIPVRSARGRGYYLERDDGEVVRKEWATRLQS